MSSQQRGRAGPQEMYWSEHYDKAYEDVGNLPAAEPPLRPGKQTYNSTHFERLISSLL